MEGPERWGVTVNQENADSLKWLWHLMQHGRGKRASSLVLLLCTFCNTFITTLIHMPIHLFIHSANVPGVNCTWRQKAPSILLPV